MKVKEVMLPVGKFPIIKKTTILKEESEKEEITDKEENKEEDKEENKESQEPQYSSWQHLLFTS